MYKDKYQRQPENNERLFLLKIRYLQFILPLLLQKKYAENKYSTS